jgi:lipoprotein NlpI
LKMRALEFALGLWLLALPACAQSASDLVTRGNEYTKKGDYANAIAAYTQALQLNPASARVLYARGYAYYRIRDDDRAIQDFTAVLQLQQDADVFRARAQTLEDKSDYERAIQDYTQAIRLRPADVVLLYGRAFDYERKGEYAPAIVDLNEIVRRFPEAPDAYRNRGVAFLNSARLPEAQKDMSRAVQLNPTEHYNVIWLYIARTKNVSGAENELAKNAAKLDLSKWPGPVIQLFLGKSTPDAVLQAASNKDKKTNAEQQCEAEFYIAEYDALHGQTSAASKGFRSVVDSCDKNYFLYVPSARAELLAVTKDWQSRH